MSLLLFFSDGIDRNFLLIDALFFERVSLETRFGDILSTREKSSEAIRLGIVARRHFLRSSDFLFRFEGCSI